MKTASLIRIRLWAFTADCQQKNVTSARSLDPLTCDSLLLQEEELLLLLWLVCRPTGAVPDRLPLAATAVPVGAPGSSRPGTNPPSAPLFQSFVRHSRLDYCSTKYESSLLLQFGSGYGLANTIKSLILHFFYLFFQNSIFFRGKKMF
jgi:hypothetical protein